jgi:hypothetical protein
MLFKRWMAVGLLLLLLQETGLSFAPAHYRHLPAGVHSALPVFEESALSLEPLLSLHHRLLLKSKKQLKDLRSNGRSLAQATRNPGRITRFLDTLETKKSLGWLSAGAAGAAILLLSPWPVFVFIAAGGVTALMVGANEPQSGENPSKEFESLAKEFEDLLIDAPRIYRSLADPTRTIPATDEGTNVKHFARSLAGWEWRHPLLDRLFNLHQQAGFVYPKPPHVVLSTGYLNALKADIKPSALAPVDEAKRLIFQTCLFDNLCLLAMRAMDAPDLSTRKANLQRLRPLLSRLQRGKGVFQTSFVKDVSGLFLFPFSALNGNEQQQMELHASLIEAFGIPGKPNPWSLRFLADQGRHLRMILARVAGKKFDHVWQMNYVLRNNRFINSLDYPVTMLHLIPNLELFEQGNRSEPVLTALAHGLSADIDLFLDETRMKELSREGAHAHFHGQPVPKEMTIYSTLDEHAYPTDLPRKTWQRYFALLSANAEELGRVLEAKGYASEKTIFNPLGREDDYPDATFTAMLLATLRNPKVKRATYEDLNSLSNKAFHLQLSEAVDQAFELVRPEDTLSFAHSQRRAPAVGRRLINKLRTISSDPKSGTPPVPSNGGLKWLFLFAVLSIVDTLLPRLLASAQPAWNHGSFQMTVITAGFESLGILPLVFFAMYLSRGLLLEAAARLDQEQVDISSIRLEAYRYMARIRKPSAFRQSPARQATLAAA